MPTKGTDVLPDFSKPETTGREPSIDEKKEDVTRFRDMVSFLYKAFQRAEGLNDPGIRNRAKEELEDLRDRFNDTARIITKEIRDEVNKRNGNTAKFGGSYQGGIRGNRGGPKL